MPDATDVIWLSILPSMKDFASTLAKDGQKEADKGGRHLGATMGKSMLAGMAVVVGGAGLAGKALYSIGETFDDVTDTIRTGTGATGKNLDALVASAKNVGKNVPADFGAIGTAVADINTRMGLTGPTLEKVASQFLELGRITGEEVDIGKTSAAFNQFGIQGEAVSGSLDRLYTISQATGISVNDLAAKVTAAGPAAQTLGFSFEETAAMVGNLDKAGLNSNATIAAMQKSLVTLAKDGEKPKDAFNRVVGEIDGFIKSGDEAAALNLAGKVFGTRGAPQFIGAIKSGALNLADLGAVAGETGDSILEAGKDTADFAEQWQIFKNRVMVIVEPLATLLFTVIGDGMQWINDNAVPVMQAFIGEWEAGVGAGGRLRDVFNQVADAVRAGFGWMVDNWQVVAGFAGVILSIAAAVGVYHAALSIYHGVMIAVRVATVAWTGVQWLLNVALNANPIGLIVLAIAALVGAIILAWNHSETFRNVVLAVWGAIKWAAEQVVDWFVQTALPTLKRMWDAVVAGFIWLRDMVGAAIKFVVDFVIGYFQFWRDTLMAIGQFIWDGLTRGWQVLRDGVVAVVTFLVNAVIGYFQFWRDTLMAIGQFIWDGLTRGWQVLRDGVVAVVTFLVNAVIGYFQFWRDTLMAIGQFIWDGLTRGWQVLRDGVVAVVTFLVNAVIVAFGFWRDTLMAIGRFIWDGLTRGWQVLRDGVVAIVRFLVDQVVSRFIWWRDMLVTIAGNVRDWVLDRFERLRSGSVDLFQRMVDGIGRVWDRLRAVASAPVKFVIETVINNGIIAGWNGLVGLLKLPDSLRVGRLPVPAFARGGVLPGPGTSNGDDMVVVDRYGRPRATVASGEPVISREAYAQNKGTIDAILAGRSLHGPLPDRIPGYFMGGILPVPPGRISQHRSGYGFARWAGDMARPMGTPVVAWNDGTVAYTRRLATSYGHHIMMNHGALGSSLYAHLSRIAVAAGQRVARGQLIGNVGSTGNSTGPHLHFEVRGGNAPISASGSDQGESSSGLFDMALRWVTDRLSAPVRALLDRVPGAGMFVDAAKGMGTRLLDAAVEKIKGLLPNIPGGEGFVPGGSGAVPGLAGVTGNTYAKAANILNAARAAGHRVSTVGGYRGDGEHVTRRALDFMVPNKAAGDFIANYVWGNRARLGLQHVIWWQRIISQGRAGEGWRQMADRGSYTQNHMDHPHVLFGPQDSGLYDNGGWLPPGVTMARNETGKPEAILTSEQWKAIMDGRQGLTVNQDITVNNPVNEPTSDSAMAMSGMIGQLVGR